MNADNGWAEEEFILLYRIMKNQLQLPKSLPPMPTPPLSHFHPLEPSLTPNLSCVMRDVLTNRAET